MEPWLKFVKEHPLTSSGLVVILVGAILMGSITASFLNAGGNTYTTDLTQPGTIARLYFKDGTSSYNAGSVASPMLVLDNGGLLITKADVTIYFEPSLAGNVSVSINQSDCANFTTNTIDSHSGEIHLVCSSWNEIKGQQLQNLAQINLTPTGLESPVLSFSQDSFVSTGASKNVLQATQNYVVSLANITKPSIGLVTVAADTSLNTCTTESNVTFSWLQDANVTSFLYSWGTTASSPGTSTISREVTLSLQKGVNFFMIQAMTDNGSKGPIRTLRVESCN